MSDNILLSILQAYSFSTVQATLQIHRILEKKGIDWTTYEKLVQEAVHDPEFTPPLRSMPDRIRDKLEKANISWEQFIAWVERLKYDRLPDGIKLEKSEEKLCPKCGHRMVQSGVNTSRCNQVEGDWNSIWTCINCEYDELDTKPVPTYGRKRKKSSPSRIINPRNVRMLYYGNVRRRLR